MIIIGEKINGTRKQIARAISERDADRIRDLARRQLEAGVRDKVKIIIGGGQVDECVSLHVGADAWTTDAVAGGKCALGLMNK